MTQGQHLHPTSRAHSAAAPDMRLFGLSRRIQAQALLIVAVLFGGGGVGYGLANGLVQVFALLLMGLNYPACAHFVRRAPRVLVILCLVTLLLPALQIIPLPPAIWQQLPGRDLVENALRVLGDPAGQWFTFSVDRMRTLTALVGLFTPLAMIVLAWDLDDADRLALVRTVIWVGLASVCLGIVQAATGNPDLTFYTVSDGGIVVRGTFANRNSTAVFLDVIFVLACGYPLHAWNMGKLGLRLAIAAMFVLGVIGTMSRSGTALLLLPLAFLAMHLWAARRAWLPMVAPKGRGSSGARMVLIGVGVLAIVLVASGGGRLAMTFQRYDNLHDERALIWKDALDSARRYWPVGSGIGTFDEVFQVDESLEYISPRRAGRAHNDFLEMTIESGVVGDAVALGWIAFVAFAAFAARGRHNRWTVWSAAAAAACFAAQSGIDYPLRNQIDLCLAGLLAALLCASLISRRRSAGLPPGAQPGDAAQVSA